MTTVNIKPQRTRPIVTAFLLLITSSMCSSATTLFTHLGSGSEMEIVAVVQSDIGIEIVSYTYTLQPDGFHTADVWKTSRSVNCPVPSILVGRENTTLNREMNALYIGGKNIRDINYQANNGWMYSMWLGWVNASNYPNVYSPDDGWLYVKEESSDVFSIYKYSDNVWTIRDLSAEWFSLFMWK